MILFGNVDFFLKGANSIVARKINDFLFIVKTSKNFFEIFDIPESIEKIRKFNFKDIAANIDKFVQELFKMIGGVFKFVEWSIENSFVACKSYRSSFFFPFYN